MENQENQEKKHKRRVRYSGTHPRNYKEKYKELNPEKYHFQSHQERRNTGGDAYFYLCE